MIVWFFLFLVPAYCRMLDNSLNMQPVPDQYNILRNQDKKFLDSLKDYELVNPEETTPLNRNHMFRYIYEQDENVERSIVFAYKTTTIILDLVPNRVLLSGAYKERYFLPNGTAVIRTGINNCYYHGHVRAEETSSNLALSTYDGFHGYFRHENIMFLIQPLYSQDNNRTVHVVYKSSDMPPKPTRCGHNASSVGYLESFAQEQHRHSRVRRDVLSETKYIELIIVNAFSQFQQYSSNLETTRNRAITIANVVDSLYRPNKIRVALVLLETWNTQEQITIVTNSDTTLGNFLQYKNSILDVSENTKHHDNAQMLSQTNYDENVAGLAYLETICTTRSAGIITDSNDANAAITGAVMTHEMGHNIGLVHDDSCPNCPETAANTGCIMNAVQSTNPPTLFSTCSLSSIDTLLNRNVGYCLFNLPTQFVAPPSCGNGFMEDGEECDCGTQKECQSQGNTCCNYNTCTLYAGKKCSSGLCCSNCQFVSQGTLCRSGVNSCDVAEYCNGTTEACPDNVVVLNGVACDSNQSYCYNGQCQTHDSLCASYWDGGATSSDDICYSNQNVKGNANGLCKVNEDGSYAACAADDVKCGKLFCQGSGITLKLSPAIFGTITLTHNGQDYSCSLFNATGDTPNPGLVDDGVKCGQDKVCKDNQCQATSVVYAGQPSCSNNCNGNGICNENGNCHCNAEFKCPDCTKSDPGGPGGSVDSGVDCGVDECSDESHDCHANAICTNTAESYTCACKDGYSGDGRTSCADINVCSGSPGCQANSNCINEPGTYNCVCASGYTGDGKVSCSDINECAASPSPCTAANTECNNTPVGSYTCVCSSGYSDVGGTCTDINECSGSPGCQANSNCANAPGTYNCVCSSGYTGDGKVSCSDIDECAQGGSNDCHANADCTNIVASFTCACKTGFTGDGKTSCANINECAGNSNGCHANADCADTQGSYTCSCKSGYTGDGKTSCADIDECTVSNPCPSGQSCNNTVGSYQCSEETTIRVNIVIEQVFTNELKDPTSSQYQALEQDIKSGCDQAYASDPTYQQCNVNGFSPGSVIADVIVLFNGNSPNAFATILNSVQNGSFGNLNTSGIEQIIPVTTNNTNVSKDDVELTKSLALTIIAFLSICYITCTVLVVAALCIQAYNESLSTSAAHVRPRVQSRHRAARPVPRNIGHRVERPTRTAAHPRKSMQRQTNYVYDDYRQ